MVFTSHADAAFDVCFENILSGGTLTTYLPTYLPTYSLYRTPPP